MKFRSVRSRSSVACWIRRSPLPFSSPIERRATRGVATPSTCSLKIAPIRAYWARFSGLESGLAPMSRRTSVPPSATSWTARAGRSTPGSRPSLRTAAAMPAPVWPAVTTASAWPRFTSSVATRIELSFFSRRARAGSCSSMSDDLGGVDDRDVRRELAGEAADRRPRRRRGSPDPAGSPGRDRGRRARPPPGRDPRPSRRRRSVTPRPSSGAVPAGDAAGRS